MVLESHRQISYADGRPSANKVGLGASQAATWPWSAVSRGHRQKALFADGLTATAIGKHDSVCRRPLLASFADGGGLPMARPSAKKFLADGF